MKRKEIYIVLLDRVENEREKSDFHLFLCVEKWEKNIFDSNVIFE